MLVSKVSYAICLFLYGIRKHPYYLSYLVTRGHRDIRRHHSRHQRGEQKTSRPKELETFFKNKKPSPKDAMFIIVATKLLLTESDT